jgi:hypothetical protein
MVFRFDSKSIHDPLPVINCDEPSMQEVKYDGTDGHMLSGGVKLKK